MKPTPAPRSWDAGEPVTHPYERGHGVFQAPEVRFDIDEATTNRWGTCRGDFDRVHFHVETDFHDEDGKTRLVTRMRFPTKDVRDRTMIYGVPGHASTMHRLDLWLAEHR